MAFTSITVTGTYKTPTGANATGTVTFALTHDMEDTADKITVSQGSIVAGLTSGALSQALYANNDSTTTPTGTQYLVTENVAGVTNPAPYLVTIDHAAVGGTVDISALRPA